ncbi:uncharacterized protein MONBRDRAFT_29126 [Monosiga brevicollis MX1]|uniref:Uncharacterized protein n=1 Tax=Monosiga brevicollis TaxID=81824 RepID=A9VA73_MONBE|nr:uncharacterized protein MONBRDRAFT_29126 [Monosiga brevicollis MX1]EDQ85615.1 predicted protein [Monosiga brevicollis MX1]|eukprot:XP_001749564.1 hypothetical protein [Monosiga brevicollis MX1]
MSVFRGLADSLRRLAMIASRTSVSELPDHKALQTFDKRGIGNSVTISMYMGGSKIAAGLTPALSQSAVAVGYEIWIYGGTEYPFGVNNARDLHYIDVRVGEWHTISHEIDQCPLARFGQSMVYDAAQECFWIFGGTQGTQFYNDLWRFDLATRTWEEIVQGPFDNWPTPRYRHQAVMHNHRMVVLGGGTPNPTPDKFMDTALVFNTRTRRWETEHLHGDNADGYPPELRSHTCTKYGEYLYLLGGISKPRQYGELITFGGLALGRTDRRINDVCSVLITPTPTLKYLCIVAIAAAGFQPEEVYRAVGSSFDLVLEAALDGKSLSTDPVPHKASFTIDNELVYAVPQAEVQSQLNIAGTRELLGYVMLDLRLALPASRARASTWYPLLNCVYRKSKPELLIQLFLETMDAPTDRIPVAVVERHLEPVLALGAPASEEDAHDYALALRIKDATGLTAMALMSEASDQHALSQAFFEATLEGLTCASSPFGLSHAHDLRSLEMYLNLWTTEANLERFLQTNGQDLQLAVCFQGADGSQPLGTCSLHMADVAAPSADRGRPQEHRVRMTSADGAGGAPPDPLSLSSDESEPDHQGGLEGPDHSRPGFRRLAIGVDFQTLQRAQRPPQQLKLLVRYRTALLGTPGQYLTHPSVMVQRGSQVQLAHGFASYDLVTSVPTLDQQWHDDVDVELIEQDQYNGHRVAGRGRLRLRSLFDQWTRADGHTELVSARETVMFVTDEGEAPSEVARADVLLTLQDLGAADIPINEATFAQRPALKSATHHAALPPKAVGVEHDGFESHGQPAEDGVNLTAYGQGGPWRMGPAPERTGHLPPPHSEEYDTLSATTYTAAAGAGELGERLPGDAEQVAQQYQARLELELWMKEEQERFRQTLEEKEQAALKRLAAEWKARNGQQEAILTQRMQSYNKTSAELEATLRRVREREAELERESQELESKQAELAQQHERAMTELRDASRRLESDFAHQVCKWGKHFCRSWLCVCVCVCVCVWSELSQSRTRFQEEHLHRISEDRDQLEQRLKVLQEENEALRLERSRGPNAQLQAEVVRLSSEVQQLHRQLDAAQRSKDQYKQQWTKALHTVAQLRQKEQLLSREHLRQQQRELEHLRLQYLMKEERDVTGNEMKEIAEIKAELQRLAQLTVGSSSRSLGGHSEPGTSSSAPQTEAPAGLNRLQAEVARLTHERQSLLNTNIYPPTDPVIRQLDARIALLMSQM